MGDGRQETGDRRQETGDWSWERGDRRQEPGDLRQETGDRRWEAGDVVRGWEFLTFFVASPDNESLKKIPFMSSVTRYWAS